MVTLGWEQSDGFIGVTNELLIQFHGRSAGLARRRRRRRPRPSAGKQGKTSPINTRTRIVTLRVGLT